MDANDALDFVNNLLRKKGKETLNHVESIIFTEAWNNPNKGYKVIADETGYTTGSINTYADNVWKLLSEALKSKVVKNKLRVEIESYVRKQGNRVEQTEILIEVTNASTLEDSSLKSTMVTYTGEETRWVGHETLILELLQKLKKDCRILSIVGITGIGKTSLATRLVLDRKLEIFSLKLINFDYDSSVLQILTQKILGEKFSIENQMTMESEQIVQAIVSKLQTQPHILFLDMIDFTLETCQNGLNQFKDPTLYKLFENIIKVEDMPSRIILTSQIELPILAEGRYPLRAYTQLLRGLQETDAIKLFEAWDIKADENINNIYIKRLISIYEGHPLALRVIAGEIREQPYNGDVQAYWKDYSHEFENLELAKKDTEALNKNDRSKFDLYLSKRLEDLVKGRIEKALLSLKENTYVAYLLLCMGSAARSAAERQAWLFLISEYPPEIRKQAFNILQRRLLLEVEAAQGKPLYRLHSLVRSVGLEHLYKIE